METSTFRVGDRLLEYDLAGPASAPQAVYLHGLGSDRRGEKVQAFRGALVGRGLGFAAFDASGHGASTGRTEDLTLSRLVEEVHAFQTEMVRAHGRAGPAILIGSSLGGLTAAWAHARRGPMPVAALVLLAPAVRLVDNLLQELGPERTRQWQATGLIEVAAGGGTVRLGWQAVEDWRRHDHESLRVRVDVPTLIFHGTADDAVPVEDSRVLAKAAAAVRLVEIPGGDHRLTAHVDTLVDGTVRFLEGLGLLEGARAASR